MRLLRIRGAGLASLAEAFEIDLSDARIRDAGLFMISGPTGAGKSTILDAMTLALFDKFPRIESAGADQEIDPGDGRTEKANAPSAILSRGLAQGFAEVEFIGSDGARYRARWEIHRARRRASGDLQNSVRGLWREDSAGTEQAITGNKRELTSAVEIALGLTYEQFTRTVLLAQNRFDAFLTADDKDRASLLEKITGDYIYARISKAIYRAAAEKQQSIKLLSGKADTIEVLDAAQLERIAGEQAGHAQRLEELARSERELLTDCAWWETDDRLAGDRDAATAAAERAAAKHSALGSLRMELAQTRAALTMAAVLAAANAALTDAKNATADAQAARASWQSAVDEADKRDADHRRDQDLLATADATVKSLQSTWVLAAELDRRIVEMRREQADANERHKVASDVDATLARSLDALKHHRISLEQAKHANETILAENAHLLALLDVRDEVRRAFDDRASLTAKLRSSERDLVDKEAQSRNAEHSATRSTAAIRETATALLELQERMAPMASELAGDRLYRAQESRSGLQAVAGRLQTLQLLATAAGSARRTIASTEAEISMATAQANAAAQMLARGERACEVLRVRLDEADLARKAVTLALSDGARRLRADLLPGQPCPVCGSHDHVRDDADLARQLGPLRDRRNEIEREMQAELQRVLDAKSQATSAIAIKANSTNALDRARRELSDTSSEWRKQLEGLPSEVRDNVDMGEPDDAKTARALSMVRADYECRMSQTGADIDRLRQIERDLSDLQSRSAAAERERVGLHEELRRADELRAKAHTAAEASRVAVAGFRSSLAHLDARLTELLQPMSVGLADLTHDSDAICLKFAQLTERLVVALRDADSSSQRLRESEAEFIRLEANSEFSKTQLDQATAALALAARSLETLCSERQELLGGEQTEAHQARHRALLDIAKAVQETSLALVSAARLKLERASTEHQLAEQKEATCRARLLDTERALEGAMAESGFHDRATVEAFVRKPKSWIAEAEATLRDAEADAAAAIAARSHAGLALTDHRTTPTPKHSIVAIRSDLTGIAEERRAITIEIGKLEQCLSGDRAARDRRAAIATVLDAARTEAEAWDAVNAAIGSAEGDRFRRFAQAHTFEVLLDLANDQLRLLAPRYRLARVPGTDLSLQVVDRDMADEVRGARSLSGGERFLVSLAMALALSTLGAGKALVETLFIDEGFGSLDPQSLELALEGLDALRSQGRIVGVISHVEAMRERIPVQIVVSRQGAGRSCLRLQVST